MDSNRDRKERFAAAEAEDIAHQRVPIEPDRSPAIYAFKLTLAALALFFALSSVASESVSDDTPKILGISALIGLIAFFKERRIRRKWSQVYEREYQRIMREMIP